MSEGARLSVPMRSPEDVRSHLGKAYHWKAGHSAQALAYRWFEAVGLPSSVTEVLGQVPWFESSSLVDAFLERRTDLRDGCGAPSQTDLLAIVTADRDTTLSVVAVEAKVRESFGPFVAEWLDGSERKVRRLAKLCELFRIEHDAALKLRYPLLHRAAAAVYESERYRCNVGAFIVQSFCPEATGLGDFIAFARALGYRDVERNRMSNGIKFGSTVLLLGWVADTIPANAAALAQAVKERT